MKADGRDPPSLRRSIVLNAANLGLNILFPLVSFAYTARILGPEAMGRVGFAFAASGIFLVLASLSLPIYGAKAVAQARDKREALDATFSELFLLNLAASA
ncbi:MAG TPA: oligosaccharide flippase family protein, partial [Fibrobacteria bacterium]|nr:oligosaccharide flippase family protein [Fibrobacteria bacterium]